MLAFFLGRTVTECSGFLMALVGRGSLFPLCSVAAFTTAMEDCALGRGNLFIPSFFPPTSGFLFRETCEKLSSSSSLISLPAPLPFPPGWVSMDPTVGRLLNGFVGTLLLLGLVETPKSSLV